MKPEYTYTFPIHKTTGEVHYRFDNLTGRKFGKLTVMDLAYGKLNNRGMYAYHWNCVCDCGNKTVVSGGGLRTSQTTSCGCVAREASSLRLKTHGLTKHPLYARCLHQIKRCHDPENSRSKNYYHRGITVQKSWRDNIELMIREVESEIGLPPFEGAQIDRINNDLGYESGNIRWVDNEGNARNKRYSHNHCKDPETRYRTPTYSSWTNLCYRAGDEVCAEWRWDGDHDSEFGFKTFLKEMGERPEGTRLYRIDSSLPYNKWNCHWKPWG